MTKGGIGLYVHFLSHFLRYSTSMLRVCFSPEGHVCGWYCTTVVPFCKGLLSFFLLYCGTCMHVCMIGDISVCPKDDHSRWDLLPLMGPPDSHDDES